MPALVAEKSKRRYIFGLLLLPFHLALLTWLPVTPHRYAVYDSRRISDRHWLCTASMAAHAALISLFES